MALNSGSKAWLGLLTGILAYDLYAIRYGKQTLSTAFYEALEHPKKRWVVIACWSILTNHLFGITPRKYDVISALLKAATPSIIEI